MKRLNSTAINTFVTILSIVLSIFFGREQLAAALTEFQNNATNFFLALVVFVTTPVIPLWFFIIVLIFAVLWVSGFVRKILNKPADNGREKQLEIYRQAQTKLGDLFVEHASYLTKHRNAPDQEQYSKIIETARKELRMLPLDATVTDILERLTPYFVTQKDNVTEYEKWGNWDSRNRNAIDDALRHISSMINA